MESRKMPISLIDNIFGSGQENQPTSFYNDRSNNSRLSDLLHRENSAIDFHRGGLSSIQFEDNCRSRNYERQALDEHIGSVGLLLEEQRQQKIRLKAHQHFQDRPTCSMFSTRWNEVEKHSDYQARKNQEYERTVIESAQSIMPFEYEYSESPVQSQIPAERESALLDECVNDSNYIKHGTKNKHYNPGQFTNKITRKCETQHDKSQYLFLLNEFGTIHEKCQSLQTNLTLLKEEKQSLVLKIIELNRDIGILEEQKMMLGTTLVEYKEREKLIECEIKQSSSQMEKLKHELRKRKSSNDIYDVANQSIENIMKNGQKDPVQLSKENNRISKQYALELQLLQDIHKEELRLYKLKLAHAAEQIRVLKVQLQDHYIKKELIKERHHGSKYKKQNPIMRENSLVDDGDSLSHKHKTKLKDVDEYKKIHNRPVCRKSGLYDNESLLFENSVCGDVTGNRFHLESLRNSILSNFEAFKKEMLNVIREKIKENVLSDHDGLTMLGNNVQLTKKDEAANNDGDKQSHVGYVEDSTIWKRRNPLNCGTGMAFSFYYGYLKLILPVGISTLGIKRRILKYIEDERLSESAFPMKKLIILIPHNAYIPTSLKELSIDDPSDGNKYWIEAVKPLQPEVIKRYGWERDFHNPVYKIKDPNSRSGICDYVVAEYATPVKVINDIHKCPVSKISEAYKVHQQKIISCFYKSLLERIRRNNDGCRDLCEIIYYPDTDSNGKRVNIGRIILDRIHSRSASCYQ